MLEPACALCRSALALLKTVAEGECNCAWSRGQAGALPCASGTGHGSLAKARSFASSAAPSSAFISDCIDPENDGPMIFRTTLFDVGGFSPLPASALSAPLDDGERAPYALLQSSNSA